MASMRATQRLVLISGLVLLLPSAVLAQQFVGGAFVVSWQPEGTVVHQTPHTPTTGIGGTGVGVGLILGEFFNPKVAFEVEFTMPGRFDALQGYSDFYGTYEGRVSHRDRILSGLIRFKSIQHGPEFVAGVSWVTEETWFPPASESVVRDTIGLTGGVDFPIPLNSRLSITPQLRVHLIARPGNTDDIGGTLGLSPLVWRPAIAVIANFERHR
jgi:hypothetical protein